MLHTINISVFGFKVIGKLSKKIYDQAYNKLDLSQAAQTLYWSSLEFEFYTRRYESKQNKI